ncbi:hypothetical protein CCR75_001025 [Bremia lactucae]|uniref:Uncharacterized protein n=1 Tax=Bremia lactucae TaxID=4779 RepID=A0A976II28_BRELC|nr:hypothetical protein CCR75_001025 [Bremia lactucae]
MRSESSDEELATLHAAALTAPKPVRKLKTTENLDTKASRTHTDHGSAKTRSSDDSIDPEEAQRLKREARKKRKVNVKAQREVEKKQQIQQQLDTERDSKGRAYTLSMAIPGSILDNAQTKELKTYLAGQVARAAVIFQVDEIIVFDDQLAASASTSGVPKKRAHDCHVFMARILQYLETPQYLRRALFPMHSDLSCAGLLNPLDCPHHLRAHEWSVYREGVVTDRPLKEKEGSHVYVGLSREVVVDKRIQPGIRVTVKIDEASKEFKKKMVGTLVSLAEPREQLGVYWGYTTRFAPLLSNVWTDCPFSGGYDLKIGTSERGTLSVDDPGFSLPTFRHALIVFGGVAGLEECVDADETVVVSGEDSSTLFDMWVNTCPEQGSRTIRSEEALLISLAALRPHLFGVNDMLHVLNAAYRAPWFVVYLAAGIGVMVNLMDEACSTALAVCKLYPHFSFAETLGEEISMHTTLVPLVRVRMPTLQFLGVYIALYAAKHWGLLDRGWLLLLDSFSCRWLKHQLFEVLPTYLPFMLSEPDLPELLSEDETQYENCDNIDNMSVFPPVDNDACIKAMAKLVQVKMQYANRTIRRPDDWLVFDPIQNKLVFQKDVISNEIHALNGPSSGYKKSLSQGSVGEKQASPKCDSDVYGRDIVQEVARRRKT